MIIQILQFCLAEKLQLKQKGKKIGILAEVILLETKFKGK